MENGARVSRPLTGQLRLPDDASALDVTRAFWTQYGKESIVSCQSSGKSKFEITFGSTRFYEATRAGGLLIADTKIFLEPLEETTRWLTLRNAPYELPRAAIVSALSTYGHVLHHEFEVPAEMAPVTNGNRRIRMRMRRPVPNFLKIGAYNVMVTYAGVVRLCRRCNGEGHVASACATPFCKVCHEWGHDISDCPDAAKHSSAQRLLDFPSLEEAGQAAEEASKVIPAVAVPEVVTPATGMDVSDGETDSLDDALQVDVEDHSVSSEATSYAEALSGSREDLRFTNRSGKTTPSSQPSMDTNVPRDWSDSSFSQPGTTKENMTVLRNTLSRKKRHRTSSADPPGNPDGDGNV